MLPLSLTIIDKKLKALLDKEFLLKDNYLEVSEEKPDPILIARKYKEEFSSLLCSFFAYGSAKQIVKLLKSFDFALLDLDEDLIKKELKQTYYRFQNTRDITEIFISLRRLKREDSLKNIFLRGYKKDFSVMDGIKELQKALYEINPYRSSGYSHLLLKPYIKDAGAGAYKKYNLFLRWMVRKDNIDFGLWPEVRKEDLLIPLDTHVFNLSKKLRLLDAKACNLKAVRLISNKLKLFDKNDPIKYDFAIYRLGQSKNINELELLLNE